MILTFDMIARYSTYDGLQVGHATNRMPVWPDVPCAGGFPLGMQARYSNATHNADGTQQPVPLPMTATWHVSTTPAVVP